MGLRRTVFTHFFFFSAPYFCFVLFGRRGCLRPCAGPMGAFCFRFVFSQGELTRESG